MAKPIDALIRRLETIGTVPPRGRDALMRLPLLERNLSKGQEIVADGETSSHCCMVLDGYVYRSKTLVTGDRQIFSLHLAGDVPDLHSLHLQRMDHNLAAMSDCRVAHIPHTAVHTLLEDAPELTGLFWRLTTIDAAAFRAWMLMLGQAEAVPRMAHLFCELFTRAAMAGINNDHSFELPLTQNDLADILGISLVHANRTLQELRLARLVEFQNQTLTVLRWEELRRVGQFDPAYLHLLDQRVGRVNPAQHA